MGPRVTDHGLEAAFADLEAVADDAGFDRFALLAIARGGQMTIKSGRPPCGRGSTR